MGKFNYVIFTPRNNSGGSIVLHNLCKLLMEQGENAKVLYINRFSCKNSLLHGLFYPVFLLLDIIFSLVYTQYKEHSFFVHTGCSVKGCKRKWYPFLQKNTVVIYPEIVYGNPLKADNVVRWLLYYNKQYKNVNGKPVGYEKSDLFYAYREVFNDPQINPECKILQTPYFNLDMYKRYNFGERNGNCYIIRKGINRIDKPDSFDGIIIDNLSEREKVKAFNECEYCISYDTQTEYSSIVAMCGCISVIVPEKGKTRNDYLSENEHWYGIAYGFSENEIDFAISTQSKAKERIIKLNQNSVEQVHLFVLDCEKHFR